MTDAAEQPKLPYKQERFVLAYIGEAKGNATAAARIAGYKSPHPEGSRLLRNATVRARIDEELMLHAASAAEVLAELSDIAKAEWRDFVEILEWDDKGKPLRVKMDLGAKVKSLELLGKHHQLFSENLNIHGGIEIREYVDIPEETP